MKVLEITTEISPFFKAGGLGDACNGITNSLSKRGINVRVFTILTPKMK